MTNEKQEKNERGAANQAASQNGRGRRNGGNGNGSRKNNTSFKRVNLERKRPHLSREVHSETQKRPSAAKQTTSYISSSSIR